MINRAKGFTLIELMVVVAIIGIISAIAFPSYDSYMKKGRRADAKTALTKIVDRQERHYLENNTYSATLTAINVDADSDEKYYKLSILSANTKGFKAKATAQGAQLSDTDCKSLEIDAIGAKTSNAGVDDANNCW